MKSDSKFRFEFIKFSRRAWFPVFILCYVFLVSAAMIFRPMLALLLLLPLIVVLFWLAPSVRSYPRKLLLVLFFFWLMMSFLWPPYLALNLPGFPSIDPSRIALMSLIVVWLFYIINSSSLKQNVLLVYNNNVILLKLLLLLVLSRIFSVFFSEVPFQSLFYFIKDLVEVFLPVLILISILSRRKNLEQFFFVLAVVGAVIICISVMELLINKNIFLLYLPSGFVVSSEFIEQSLKETVRRGEVRVKGPFTHPLLLAQFLVVMLPIYAYFLYAHSKKVVRVISFVLILLSILVLYKTGARSAFVGIAAEIIVALILYLKWVVVTKKASVLGWLVIISYPVFILLGFFIFYLTIDFFVGQTAGEVSSTNARFIMWEKGLSIIMDSPVFGFGSGSAGYVLNFIGGSGFLTIDSYYLSILLNYGYLGLLLFVGYFILVFYLALKLINSNPTNSPMLIMILASIVGYLTVALILSTAHNLHMLFLFSALIPLLYSECRRQEIMRN